MQYRGHRDNQRKRQDRKQRIASAEALLRKDITGHRERQHVDAGAAAGDDQTVCKILEDGRDLERLLVTVKAEAGRQRQTVAHDLLIGLEGGHDDPNDREQRHDEAYCHENVTEDFQDLLARSGCFIQHIESPP